MDKERIAHVSISETFAASLAIIHCHRSMEVHSITVFDEHTLRGQISASTDVLLTVSDVWRHRTWRSTGWQRYLHPPNFEYAAAERIAVLYADKSIPLFGATKALNEE